jgi:hypothetical protein
MGIRKGPGPYRMSPGHLLPKFAPVPKPPSSTAAPLNQLRITAAGHEQPPARICRDRPAPTAGLPGLEPASLGAKVDARRMFTRLATHLARWARSRGQVCFPNGSKAHVQMELSLGNLKVVRNDLKDSDCAPGTTRRRSDLNLRPARKPMNSPAAPLGMVWNRLSARLLRQAAEEFNSMQEERGKLLSQAGHGSASAHGS